MLPGYSRVLLLLLVPKTLVEDPDEPSGESLVPLAVSWYLAAMGGSLAVLWLLVSPGAALGVSLGGSVGVRVWGGVPASLSWRIVRLDCVAECDPPL